MIINNILCAIFLSVSLPAIENSIIPQIEKFEVVENLPQKKFSTQQFLEIQEALGRKEEKIRVVSYNVLCNITEYKIAPENWWKFRCPLVLGLLEEMQPDVFGVQELYGSQLEDIFPSLEKTYEFFSRDKSSGEMNGIFYRKERFELVNSIVYQLRDCSGFAMSDTVTFVQLRDKKTNKKFAVFNTHLEFYEIDERDSQARFIIEKMGELSKEMPVLLMGDLNTFPGRLDLEKLPFYDGDYIRRLFAKAGLMDARECSLLGHFGPISTFTNEGHDPTPFKGTGTPGVFLDHFYVSDAITILSHGVQAGTINGHFPSDHMPILIDLLLEKIEKNQ
jgi:endonuclease/exonuclease/phosphatase family metal-dependent hydrolase